MGDVDANNLEAVRKVLRRWHSRPTSEVENAGAGSQALRELTKDPIARIAFDMASPLGVSLSQDVIPICDDALSSIHCPFVPHGPKGTFGAPSSALGCDRDPDALDQGAARLAHGSAGGTGDENGRRIGIEPLEVIGRVRRQQAQGGGDV